MIAQSINWPEKTNAGRAVSKSQRNISAFLTARGISLHRDTQRARTVVIRDDVLLELDQWVFRSLWLEADKAGLQTPKRYFQDVVEDIAARNPREQKRGPA